jgi:hypothetical protein
MRAALRFSLVFSVVACWCSPAQAAPELLTAAVAKLVEAEAEWAYTQVIRRADKPQAETIARFDPTKPREAQWELVKLRGKVPSSSEAEKWCRRRAQEITKSDGLMLVELLDLEKARVANESETQVRFEIPLKKNALKRVPAENFVVYADVARDDLEIQRFSFLLRQSIRLIGGAAHIEKAQGEVIFRTIENGEPTRPVYASASGHGQALFKKVSRSAEVFYIDQRKVKS